jgi:hypothetical protein
LLDELPLAGDILPGLDSPLKARLFHAFDLQVLWNKPGRQATVFAEITEATLRALPALLNPRQDGYDDTAEPASDEAADVEDLFEAPIAPCAAAGGIGPQRSPRHRPKYQTLTKNPFAKPYSVSGCAASLGPSHNAGFHTVMASRSGVERISKHARRVHARPSASTDGWQG